MKRFSLRLFALGIALGALGAAVVLAAGAYASAKSALPVDSTPPLVAPAQPDQVIKWNRILLGILRTPGAQPATIHSTRSMAILGAAVYDAVNAIDRTHAEYLIHLKAPPHASEAAAAAVAAHGVVVQLYPNQTMMLDADLGESLAQVPDGRAKEQGARVGDKAAQLILALRTGDGSAASPIPFTPGPNPGDYQLTPPAFVQPVFTHWPFVKPFALLSANQFRPPAPPPLTSKTYTADFNEVKDLGAIGSATRTTDQTQIARFWGAPIQNYWNEIAQTAALEHGTTLAQNARLFALLDLSLADSAIAFYDAKYTYHFWRPITAIRAAATNGNPATVADPTWTPLATTALDPSYPGAHAVISVAGADVLATFFGNFNDRLAVTSEVLPGVVRSSRASRPRQTRRVRVGSTQGSTSVSTRSPGSTSAPRSPASFCGTSSTPRAQRTLSSLPLGPAHSGAFDHERLRISNTRPRASIPPRRSGRCTDRRGGGMKRHLLLACFVLAIVLLAAGGWAVEALRGSK